MTTATIAAGATVSGAVDLTVYNDIGRQRLDGITLPANWTPGSISFLNSPDGGLTYEPIYLPGGSLYGVTAAAGEYVALDLGIFDSISNFKIVSSATQVTAALINLNLVDPAKAVALEAGISSGSGGGGGSGGSTTLTETISQTVIVLAANTSTLLISANASRKSLRWMVVTSNPMTVAPGTGSVTVGQGMNYGGSSGVGQQGGSEAFMSDVPTNAFSAVSALGTTVSVWEGM